MTGTKSVLVVGLDPSLIDFSKPGYPPGMDATKVRAGIKSSEDELTRLGYSVQMCLTDCGETAEAVVRRQLQQERYDCVMIGAGVRPNPDNFLLFEKLIKVVHEHEPRPGCPANAGRAESEAGDGFLDDGPLHLGLRDGHQPVARDRSDHARSEVDAGPLEPGAKADAAGGSGPAMAEHVGESTSRSRGPSRRPGAAARWRGEERAT